MTSAHLTSFGAIALLVACNPGAISDPAGAGGGGAGGPGGGGGAPLVCGDGSVHVSARPLRRLTPEQYANTLRDLVGDDAVEPAVDDEATVLTERGVRQLRAAAELVLERRAQWTRSVFPCDLDGASDEACVAAFVDGFATRAFRRPPTADERAWLMGVYSDANAELGFRDAMEVLLQVVLQAPQVVFVDEAGVERDGLPEGVRALTDFELASRLSYYLWNTMPDDALLEAATGGELGSGTGLRDHAERMLMDPRAEATVQSFFWRWMQLDGGRLHHALEDTEKDATLFPEYDQALRVAMRSELEAFVRRVFFEEGASFDRLLTDTSAYVDPSLAALYGVEGGPTAAGEWQWVELDGARRGGLLTRAAFLTVFSAANVQSPIRRGVFVMEEVLCQELGEPPPNASDVAVTGGEVDDGAGGTVVRSVREDVQARTSEGSCTTCHSVINPVGFAFEHYDAIGRWQDTEALSGREIDSSGRLSGTDVDGEVADALELSHALARSSRVRQCLADRWLGRALGHSPGEQDQCTREAVQSRFAQSGSMRELLLAIVESDAFRYLNVAEEEGR
jgi:hypothetical protein